MAFTISSIQASKGVPKSVNEITKDASSYEFNALIPLKYWLRTATALLKQAQVYMREGDDEITYFLLFRHAHLFLSNLATHPEFQKSDPTIRAIEREVAQSLKALDVLRPRINRRCEEYRTALQVKLKRREQEVEREGISDVPRNGYADLAPEDRTYAQLSGYENTDIATRLAGQEFSRRGPSRRAYPTGASLSADEKDLAAHMQAIRSTFDQTQNNLPSDIDRQRQAYLQNNTGYKYPVVPLRGRNGPQPSTQSPANRPPVLPFAHGTERPPALPPKPEVISESRLPNAPARPVKSTHTAVAVAADARPEPTYTFAPGASLENGTPLRTIFLPPTLRTTFLRLAYKNTVRNVETCGFLAGTLKANALFVSALVVPKQTATSDTCEMTDESELFDYVDQHDLMILGWIHTHPTQTCFMSSRDLHTHSGYQMMLAESIAVVCAPSKGDTSHGGDFGVYRLTDPPGKMAILQCDKPGIFHPHDVDNIYTDAMRPGHVMELSEMDFEVVDLR